MPRSQMLKWRRESVLDIYNLLLGLFLLVTPWLFSYANEGARVDVWASGAAIVVVSFATLIAFAKWEKWLTLLLGVSLSLSPWVIGFTHTRAMHFSIGIGAVVAFLSALELWLEYDSFKRATCGFTLSGDCHMCGPRNPITGGRWPAGREIKSISDVCKLSNEREGHDLSC